jgi:hypothetical protein
VTIGILLIVRQSNRVDIEAGGSILRELAGFQRELEASWLDQQQNQKREALLLLSLYHLAHAVIRSAEFLLSGSVETDGRTSSDILPELRRYLVRAEEFLSLVGNEENSSWLVSVAIALMFLRASSVWVQSRGISERIDSLLTELTHSGRLHPVFSLLPSQQDAIRQAFLDRSRLAVVLQMPTSAGKTLLAEFAIAQTFDAYRDQTRVVYLVPTRALATQTRRTLSEDLGPLKISVSAAGSAFEEDPYELNLLAEADGVVVATPEKLDLLLRAHPEWFRTLRLVVVDEAHLLNDGERGSRLELLLANLRKEQPEARLLLLTPFMENADQIAKWLSRERGHAINVQWRPSRILLGLSRIEGQRGAWRFRVDWTDPYSTNGRPKPLTMPIGRVKGELGTNNTSRVLFLARKFQPLGTALAMFSASPSVYAKLRNDPILATGPQEIMRQGEQGLYRLLEALQWLPELNLALGFGPGRMEIRSVAKAVQGWIDGREVHELAPLFPGDDIATKRRNAAKYVYGTVSQSMSWGTHAYLRGWLMTGVSAEQPPEDKMLPAYMQ